MKPAPTPASRAFELYDDHMPVRRYKLLLQAFLKRRGPGVRQAIAEALGHSRSSVTQLTSPAYDMAIPAQHLGTIIRLASLSPIEERMFLDAYMDAHPERELPAASTALTLRLPRLASPRAQERLAGLVERFAADMAVAMLEQEAELLGKAAAPDAA